MADFYDLLGVSRDADADTLKRSYRRLARQYHPDINKDPGGFLIAKGFAKCRTAAAS